MKQMNDKIQQYLKEFWKYKDLLTLLVTKNIKLKYRRSWLGYVWSVLNPLLIMIVMSIVFSTMFSRNIENFPVYLFCGQLLFNYMNQSTHQALSSITSNASLLKKTYVPKYIFTVAKITSGLLDLLFSMGALVIVMIVTRAKVTWCALLFPTVLLQLYVFCIGLGLFLAQAGVFFKDTEFIYNAVTTAWMYLSAIFYPLEALSGKVLELQTDIEGLKVAHQDARGELSSLELTIEGIATEVSRQQTNGENLMQQMTQIRQTADQVSIAVQEIANSGVSKVRTQMGYTFDDEGLKISRSDAEMTNLLDNTGMYVRRGSDTVLQANNEGVEAMNITVRNYLSVGQNARFEDYNNGSDSRRTACFFTGG